MKKFFASLWTRKFTFVYTDPVRTPCPKTE